MDEGLSRAVKRHFVQLYNEGLIYRGKRIVNWCPRCGTAISDIEVKYETKKGHLWFIRYGEVIVATTRPETMLGDTAVAVNPNDDRYKHLHGKVITLPLVGRKIPIITDDFVDPKFGTGAVKVTPAHDPNDFEMGERHNLPRINILTPEAKVTLAELEEGEKRSVRILEGLDRFKAREEIVKLLVAGGYIEKIEDYENSVGECHRCNTVVEPYLSDQWFVKIKPLAEKAIAAVEDGRVKFVPERWNKVYLQWMTNLRDWCISRQLWWGHQVPAYYCKSEILNTKSETNSKSEIINSKLCEEIIVSETRPEKCPKCGGTNIIQDPDVFDTWFSSALWPFSTLGWPDETEDLKTFYPTDVLVTSYDIIFFWVARMIMAGEHLMGKVPFHTVYFNALVKDINGKKMSKSWGNVIDPLEVIDRAGADALRFAFISLCAGQGQDIKLSEEKITEARNFANKIWNSARFVLMAEKSGEIEVVGTMELADKWILSRLNQTIEKVTKNIESYEFGEAAKQLYEFVWGEFCDWYIETAKIRLYGQDEKAKAEVQAVLLGVLETTMKVLHPFMPFMTEEIYQKLNTKHEILNKSEDKNPNDLNSIMLKKWPTAEKNLIDPKVEEEMERVMEIVRTIRNIRATLCIQPGKPIKLHSAALLSETIQGYIKALAKIGEIEISNNYPKHTIVFKVGELEFGLPVEGLVDFAKESERLQKEHDKLAAEIEKIKVKLKDENFLKHASESSVQKENQKIGEYNIRLVTLGNYIKALRSQ